MLRIEIGMKNYTGVACGFGFEKSVAQNVPEDMELEDPRVRRLLALFPGSTAKVVSTANSKKVEESPKVAKAPEPASQPPAEDEESVVEDTTPDAEVVKDGEPDEEVEEEVEEVEEPEKVEEPPAEEAPFKTFAEKVQELVDGNSREQLVEMADEMGVTYGSRSNKTEIATEIVEAQQAQD